MHRTEGANNLANLFRDGPPGTTVEEDWLNAVQEEIAYVIEQAGLTLKSANTETRTQLKEALDNEYVTKEWSVLSRAQFTYNGGAAVYTVKVSGAVYMVKDKTAKWSAELTTGAIGTPVASTRYYLYLDYSAITQGTDITASQLIWSSTAPTYSHTYKGWYNGDDLCVFGVITNAGPTNILEFFHDGGELVLWADQVQEYSGTPSNVWTDVDMASSVPAFASNILVQFACGYVDTNTNAAWRTNGQSGSTGHYIAAPDVTATHDYTSTLILSDSSQIIEVRYIIVTAGNTIIVYSNGWGFPVGM